jgi:4-aminobutyrate aminotransferase-like enzyme
MDAVHLMRAITGRKLIIKIEGTYHGHHDALMISSFKAADQLGPVDDPHRVPGSGIPQEMADLVRIVPFNDLAALAARARGASGADGRDDRRADDDERGHHPAAAGLPGGRARAHAATACWWRSTR